MTVKRLVIIITLLIASMFYLASNCDNGAGVEPIVGTWVNPDYNGMGGEPGAKVIFGIDENGNLNVAVYDNVSDTEPLYTSIGEIPDSWTDSYGATWYKTVGTLDSNVYYSLVKISPDGNTMESNTDTNDYPSEINPEESMYVIYYRQ